MKVFEVGLVCEFEGGHGVLMADNDRLFANAKMYLLGAVEKQAENMAILFDSDDEYSRKQLLVTRKEAEKAINEINASKNIEDLKSVAMDDAMLVVRLYEREVLGAGLDQKEGA